MNNQDLIEKLDQFSQTLNGIGGRLLVARLTDSTVSEAHGMALKLGIEIDDLINDLMEED